MNSQKPYDTQKSQATKFGLKTTRSTSVRPSRRFRYCELIPPVKDVLHMFACPDNYDNDEEEEMSEGKPDDVSTWAWELQQQKYGKPPSKSQFRKTKYRWDQKKLEATASSTGADCDDAETCSEAPKRKFINPFSSFSSKKKKKCGGKICAGEKRMILKRWGKLWDSALSDLQFERTVFENNPDAEQTLKAVYKKSIHRTKERSIIYKNDDERINDGCQKLCEIAKMNQNVITMMMKKFVSGPPNKLYTLNRIEAAQCWDRIINDEGVVNEKCCVNVPPHKDFRKFNIPSLKTPKALLNDPKIFKQMSVFRLPSPTKGKEKKVDDCCRTKSDKTMRSLQSSAIASTAAATSRFQGDMTSTSRQGASISRSMPGENILRSRQGRNPSASVQWENIPTSRQEENIPTSRQGTSISQSRQGSLIPTSRQEENISTSRQRSIIPYIRQGASISASSHGSIIKPSRQGASISASRQGSIIPPSRQGASISTSRQGENIQTSGRKAEEEPSFKKNPTYWLDPKLVPPVPPGFRESEFEMEPHDDPTGEIRRDLLKAKETARRYTRFAHIIEKAIHVIPNLDRVDKAMDEHFVARDPSIRRQTLLHNFFSSPKMDTSPEFKRDAMYATILSRNDNPKENVVKKPFPYSLAEMSKSKMKIR